MKASATAAPHNELEQLRTELASHANSHTHRIQNLLKSIYDDDLKDAHLIANKLTHQVKNKSSITNDLYENAYNRNLLIQKPNLNPTLSSMSKSVLVPKCKSLTSLRIKPSTSCSRSIDLNNEVYDESSIILTRDCSSKRSHSSSTRHVGRSLSSLSSRYSFEPNNDDLVYILNNLKTKSDYDYDYDGIAANMQHRRSTTSLNGYDRFKNLFCFTLLINICFKKDTTTLIFLNIIFSI